MIVYLKSNLGDVIEIELSRCKSNIVNNGLYTTPVINGSKTKYLRLLELIKYNPGIRFGDIVKNLCNGTVWYNGKNVPNNNMIGTTIANLKWMKLITHNKMGYSITDKGNDYINYSNKSGFERFHYVKE